jgi:hypothetical protein
MAVVATIFAIVMATVFVQAAAVSPGIARHGRQHKQHHA